MQRREMFLIYIHSTRYYKGRAPGGAQAHPAHGGRGGGGGAALVPLPRHSLQLRCQGQGTSQLGPPTGTQSEGLMDPSGKGTWPEEDWGLGDG